MINFESQLPYQNWDKTLQRNFWFKKWWRFWSNHAFVFYALAGAATINKTFFWQMFVTGSAAFAVSRLGITNLINVLVKRRRPYQIYKLKTITSYFFSGIATKPNSFPSRHAIVFASVATVVCMFSMFWGSLLWVVTLFMGMGRIVLGYHFPTDILAGMILGLIIGFFSYLAIDYWFFTDAILNAKMNLLSILNLS